MIYHVSVKPVYALHPALFERIHHVQKTPRCKYDAGQNFYLKTLQGSFKRLYIYITHYIRETLRLNLSYFLNNGLNTLNWSVIWVCAVMHLSADCVCDCNFRAGQKY